MAVAERETPIAVSEPEKVERFSEEGLKKWVKANWWALSRSTPLLLKMLHSIKEGEGRSIIEDARRVNDYFGMETVYDLAEAENIPKTGGVVLATSHAYSTAEFPGWKNPRAFFAWWVGGIGEVFSQRRPGEDFRAITCYEGEGGNFGSLDRFLEKFLKMSAAVLWNEGFVETYGFLPVSPKFPKLSLKSLEKAIGAVKAGGAVLFAPEGTTYTGLGPAETGGIARLLRAGQPFIPLAFGEERTPEGKFVYPVRVGEALSPEIMKDWNGSRKEKELRFGDLLMTGIAKLMPKGKRGIYASDLLVDAGGLEPPTSSM